MSDIIRLLPDAIANQIAAGEVVQRPASAVKELLENAIDAGSSKIQLYIKDAGKTLLQVIDNGKGMSPPDARLCFERHATSKISKTDDLLAIRTMGFRGEALASIAAIAQVELKTRRPEDELGSIVRIEGSKIIKQETVASPVGTSIAIKNLFFNVPARRKFLKSNPVERRHILDEFQRVAIAYPEIAFSVTDGEKEIYHLKAGNLKQRIVALFGNGYAKRLVPVEEKTGYVKISGFIGKPEYVRKSRGEQFFIINKRFIKSQLLHRAIIEAYDNLLPAEGYPFYVIFIEIDPSRIDVNVHPTKQEIKFDDEQIIITFINAAVKRSLATFSITPQLDFNQEIKWQFQPTNQKKDNTSPPISIPSAESPTAMSSGFTSSTKTTGSSYSGNTGYRKKDKGVDKNWKDMFKTEDLDVSKENVSGEEVSNKEIDSSTNKSNNVDERPADERPAFQVKQSKMGRETEPSIKKTTNIRSSELAEKTVFEPFQIHHRFIVYHVKSGIIILDQQSAHERILYEQYLKYLQENQGPIQQLMFPEKLQLSISDVQILKDIQMEVQLLGFDLEYTDENHFLIKGIPPDMGDLGDLDQLFDGILAQYRENREILQLEKRQNLARSMARQAAIKRKKVLTSTEMESLMDQLFACEKPYIAPNGRKTFIKQKLEDIDKQFQKL